MGKSEKKSKKKHKEKRKEHKEKHKDKGKKSKKHSKEKIKKTEKKTPTTTSETAAEGNEAEEEDKDFAIPIGLMNSKSHAPETPEEYERRQSQIRREVDPVTGRTRLIKGDSEVLEEIVSQDRHREINKRATSGDGEYYESHSLAAAAAAKHHKSK